MIHRPMAALVAVFPAAVLTLHSTGRQADRRACADSAGATFEAFLHQHQRSYQDDPEEYARRAALFEARAALVRAHNCAAEQPLWVARVSHVADWTDAEMEALKGLRLEARVKGGDALASKFLGSRPAAVLAGAPLRPRPPHPLPDTLSYSNLSTVRQPRDQGHCGSCWAFAAVGAMQARAELHKLPHKFSVAQLVACAPNPHECGGQGGCTGATTEQAYEYALQAGLVQETQFAYPLGGGRPDCPAKMSMSGSLAKASAMKLSATGYEEHAASSASTALRRGRTMGMIGWTKLPENREEPIIRALVESGPLTVSVAASVMWHFYSSGIMVASDCDQHNVVSHALVLYGIGKDHAPGAGVVRYWSLKNSWGPDWGEDGSLRLQRLDDEEKACGWDNKPQVGSGCRGGPESVWVCGSCGILYNAAMPMFGRTNH